MTDRVLFFSPHAGIWVHSFPEALLARALRDEGAEVIYIGCDGAFSSFCVPMAARGLTTQSSAKEKAATCDACRTNRGWLRYGLSLPGYELESALDSADDARIAELIETVDRSTPDAFTVDGAPVGRIATYEYLLQHKRSQAQMDEAQWAAFRPRLENTLRSFLAAQRILDRERPTRLVLYNSLYSVNAAWRAAADRKGIPVYFIHAGLSLSRRLQGVMLGRDSTLRWLFHVVAAWPKLRDRVCEPAELARVTDHFLELLIGSNVFAYSAAKGTTTDDWRARFGIRPGQRLLVATMSSYDEYVAARSIGEMPSEDGLLFRTQIEWIRALVSWMREQPDRFLLIRVHPREFPNKREGVKSEHAHLLERELASLPDNVRVNWPSDQLSLYDIAEHADVFLNAWSSVGKEMTMLGRPVVVYCPSLLQYPADLNYVGTTESAYFAAIEDALGSGWSFERIRMVYRWCVIEYVRAIIDIGDGFDYSEARARTPIERVRNLLFLAPGLRQARDVWRRPRALREQARIAQLILSGKNTVLDLDDPAPSEPTLEMETVALRVELMRIYEALYGSATDAPTPGTLRARLAEALA